MMFSCVVQEGPRKGQTYVFDVKRRRSEEPWLEFVYFRVAKMAFKKMGYTGGLKVARTSGRQSEPGLFQGFRVYRRGGIEPWTPVVWLKEL